MDELLMQSDKLLSMLPFNGDKTVIGAGLKVLLPVLVAKFPVLLLVSPILDGVATGLVAFGLIHKGVKGFKK